jgi:ADP-heptose:LPS heptosyltransferase
MAEAEAVLSGLGRGARVVVIRLRSMGDTVLTTPALALLKQARPDLEIFVVLERRWDRLLESNTDVAGVLIHDRSARWKTISAIRRLRPELCLNLHGGSTSASLTALSGAHWRAGFGHFGFPAVYQVRIPRAQQILGRSADAPVHTAEHVASAVFYLAGAPNAGAMDIPAARLYAAAAARPRPYAVLHVTASYFTKQWAADRFLSLARRLQNGFGLEPVILAGPGQSPWPAGMNEFPVFDNLPLGEMMSLLKGAALFVGNDSGPAHVAAAFGVPSVVIFGSSDSRIWHPWKTRYEVVETPWVCKPCPGDRCYAFNEPRCILSVEVDAVEKAVRAVIGERRADLTTLPTGDQSESAATATRPGVLASGGVPGAHFAA